MGNSGDIAEKRWLFQEHVEESWYEIQSEDVEQERFKRA